MGRLDDRVAIVTGAGQGVGLGLARALAAEGARVVIANRTRASGEAAAAAIERDFAASGAKARFVETDVSRPESIRALVAETVAHFGGVDVLVSNATPTGRSVRLEQLTAEQMQQHLDVNTLAVFHAMQAVFPPMKAAGRGRIITLCSLNGINAHRYTAMYNASKEAARTLTRTAAAEWGRYGITCNVLCPFAASLAWQGFERFDPEGAARIVAGNPLGYVGDPEADIGPVAVFLASDDARYVTGNTIHADGGGHIGGVAWQPELPE